MFGIWHLQVIKSKGVICTARCRKGFLSCAPDMPLRCRGASRRPAYASVSPMQGLRGTVSLHPLRKLGSLSAPRLCSGILMPMPPCLTSVSARGAKGPTSELTWASQPRRRRVRTPEAGPLAERAVPKGGVSAPVVRAHLRRRAPHPKIQTVCSSRPHGRGMGQV